MPACPDCTPPRVTQDCVLEDGNVQADTEATVLAACLHWAEGREGMTTEQLSELLCRIRFPSIPAATLLTYHRTFKGLQLFDPDRELLLRAVSNRRAGWCHGWGCCGGSGHMPWMQMQPQRPAAAARHPTLAMAAQRDGVCCG